MTFREAVHFAEFFIDAARHSSHTFNSRYSEHFYMENRDTFLGLRRRIILSITIILFGLDLRNTIGNTLKYMSSNLFEKGEL